MNKFKIFCISIIFLVFAVGAVGFERNPVTFTHGDFEMDMKFYSTFIDYDDYFKKSDTRDVKMINDTYAEYTDSFKEKVGALELLKIDGEEYIVDCSFDNLDKNKTKDCLKYLEEFNEVNKFKPIKVEKSTF